ncbi:MAG: tRNA pseudouridine(55) synthase TruB, partial [Clostridia bacterium]|nr:tRNA pseudouridine(55) synthase TruB [Clostridia bacterium]
MYDGILTADKPEGFTSHDAVAKIRRILGQKKIGHAGTLDPLATGVLTILLGSATRAADHAAALDKEYEATLLLGVSTDTQDITGRVLSEKAPASEEALRAVLPGFCGDIAQTPPMYSAVSVGGERLYKLARRGVEIEREKRIINVKSIEIISKISESEYALKIECSKGTYIRTLLNDIGDALSCGGCMKTLRR